jgi:pimeloyl-ACP methyl ester carboxylesterase
MMHLILLPGMDGTGLLFEPLLPFLSPSLVATVVGYPRDRSYGYLELLPIVRAAIPHGRDFLVLGESFSGPLALLLAAEQPPGLRGVILCASFARSPLPMLMRSFRRLIRNWCFRIVPKWPIRRALLGRFETPEPRQMAEAAIVNIRPTVLAARARAIFDVNVDCQLQNCSVPILYLSATEDRLVSRKNFTHIRRIQPQVKVAALTGPHLLLQVAPMQAAQVILDFAAFCSAQHTFDRVKDSELKLASPGV